MKTKKKSTGSVKSRAKSRARKALPASRARKPDHGTKRVAQKQQPVSPAKEGARDRSFVEDQSEVISSFLPDGTLSYVNDVYCRFFGKSRKKLWGHKWRPRAVAEDVPGIMRQLAKLSPRNPVVVVENRVHSGSGDVRWMQFVNRAVFDADGRMVETHSVGQDITRRKMTEEALRESEARWKFATENIGDGVWDWNLKSGRVTFSRQWKSLIGYEEDEIKDAFEEWSKRVHPDDLAGAEAALKSYIEGRAPAYSVEFRMRCKDGSWKWIHARGLATSRDDKGRPLRIIGRHTDITPRKEAKLREDRNLRLVAEGAPCAAVLDAIARSVEAEHAGLLCCIMLVGPGGGHLVAGAAPSLPDYFRKGVHGLVVSPDLACSGPAVCSGTRVVTVDLLKDKRWRELRALTERAKLRACWAEPVKGRTGQILGTVACYRRVVHVPGPAEIESVSAAAQLVALAVEREAEDQTLRDSEARHRSIMESKLAGLMFWRLDGAITDANDAFLEMIGYARDDLRANRVDWARMTPPEFRAVDERAMKELLAKGHVTPFEKEYVRKDGRRVPVIVGGALFPHRSKEGVSFVIDITDRKRAEKALLESEERYRMLADYTENMVILNDTQGNRLYVSPSFYRKTGWTEEDLAATGSRTRQHPDDLPFIDKARRDNLAGKATRIEHRHRCKDGRWIWLDTSCKPILDEKGAVWRLLVWSQDITERKKAEETLRASEDRYARAMRGTSDGLWDWNMVNGETYLSPRWKELLGFADDELPSDRETAFRARLHSEDLPRVEAALVAHLKRHAPYDVEARLKAKDGSWRWYRVRGEAVRDADGKAVRMAGSLSDITERKKAEADCKRELEFSKALVGHTAALIFVTDRSGRVVHVNKVFTDVLGWQLKDIAGKSAWEIGMMDAQEAERSRARFRNLAAGVDNPPAEIRLITTKGDVRIVEIWGTSSRDADGNVERVIVTGMDITEKHRLQQEVLRIAEQEQARIGHDLHDGVGQTMTGIGTLLEALESGLEGEQKRLAGRIRQIVQDSVAEVRRMSHGLAPSGVKNRGIDGGLRLLADTIRENYRTACECDITPGIKLADIEAETHVFRIAQEAVNNAMRHGKPKLIKLALTRLGDGECQLTVEDNGAGMKNASRKGEGIGLRVMQYRTDLIRGILAVRPRPGGGVVVTCRFPCGGCHPRGSARASAQG